VSKRLCHRQYWILTCALWCLYTLCVCGDTAKNVQSISIFLTGQELGSLKPCGCSGGQLGGLERRGAIWGGLDPKNCLILSTGNLVGSDSEQDLIKYPIFVQAYQMLGYDLVNLNSHDLQVGGLAGATEIIEPLGIHPIATRGREYGMLPHFSRVFSIGQKAIQVNVVAVDSGQFEHLDSLDTPGVTVFLLNEPNQVLLDRVIGQAEKQDCVVYPMAMDEPKLISEAGQGPMVVSIGQRGRYVSQLKLTLTPGTAEPNLVFSFQAVSEELDRNQELKALYQSYQQIVATSQLQEDFSRLPLLDSDLYFQGSLSCKGCHEEEYMIWSQKKHAHAFATLIDVGSQRDPECTICHVVGMEYEAGYLSQMDTPHLKDVGCEVCHGPGSEHNRSLGKFPTQEPKMACTNCHTPEHSGEYAGHEQEFLEKIKHWKEPKPARSVKE